MSIPVTCIFNVLWILDYYVILSGFPIPILLCQGSGLCYSVRIPDSYIIMSGFRPMLGSKFLYVMFWGHHIPVILFQSLYVVN